MFPVFSIYSTPLLVLLLQGWFLAFLMTRRYVQHRKIADLFLAVILLLTGYQCVCYTVGFMGWYDTFRNTKINYFLWNGQLALGPLIYFYVRSLTQPYFTLRRVHLWHFLPYSVYVLTSLVVYGYDVFQPGFDEVQNGVLFASYFEPYFLNVIHKLERISTTLYLAFTVQAFLRYRQQMLQFFSNTLKVELNWIRNFLLAYVALYGIDFLFGVLSDFMDLWYTDRWWANFATALALVYVGAKGYFSDVSKLYALRPDTPLAVDREEEELAPVLQQQVPAVTASRDGEMQAWKQELIDFMEQERPYLNPELNLSQLSEQMKVSSHHLSEVINSGFHKNFNDFINGYRVEAMKSALKQDTVKKLSLLGIAFECGFNSKATFNRVFKKLTGQSPTEYMASS